MNTETLSVLVIDDEPGVATMVKLALQRVGWTVSICERAKAAVAAVQNLKPNVILCDANMPELSGPQIITMLKSDSATARIPVVLMTGFAQADMFSDVEWTAFIEKPFLPKDLVDVVQRAAQTVIPPRIEHHA
jgi:two-component system phosphate regulon response regulator PhoB